MSSAPTPRYSARFEDALTFAGLRHDGQTRKDSKAPYLVHLVHVARIVTAYGYDEDHAIVALLHDVLEDTCRDNAERAEVAAEIEARFGAEVRAAVQSLTEPKQDAEGAKLPWPERKRAYIEHLEQADAMALRVSAADKIHNLSGFVASLREHGPGVWSRFRGGPEQSVWFYSAVHTAVQARLEEPIAEELGACAKALADEVERQTKEDR